MYLRENTQHDVILLHLKCVERRDNLHIRILLQRRRYTKTPFLGTRAKKFYHCILKDYSNQSGAFSFYTLGSILLLWLPVPGVHQGSTIGPVLWARVDKG